MDNVVERIKRTLLEMRVKEEQKLEEFAKSIEGVNMREVFGDLEIPGVLTLERLCPEAYAEDPDPEVYEKQYQEMHALFDQINARIAEYNAGGLEWLQKFKLL